MEDKGKVYVLSNQFIGALMMALQKAILQGSDILPVLKEWKIRVADDGRSLFVTNPPVIEYDDDSSIEEDDGELLQ
jgi:hypothetical protein